MSVCVHVCVSKRERGREREDEVENDANKKEE